MTSWWKALLFGLLVWLLPFIVAVAIRPAGDQPRLLFESVMAVVVVFITTALGVFYFRRVHTQFAREGLLLGVLWWCVCVAIDLPLMLSPPMNLTLAEYMADVGLTYIVIPIITTGIGLAAGFRRDSR